MELYDHIFKRKSTRKYHMEALPSEQLTQILDFARNAKPLDPIIATRIELADTSDIKGMAIKAPHYLLFYSEKRDGYLENAGFMLQQADLYLSSLALGSCWLGVAKTKLPSKDALSYVIMLAFGAAQGSPHRASITEFSRKALADISQGADERLEAARLAPSATNSQNWHFVCKADHIDMYRKKLGVIKAAIYDNMNQIDMGIALCHLWLASEKLGKPFSFEAKAPAPDLDRYHYVGQVSSAP